MTWSLDLCEGRWGEKIGEVSAGTFEGVVSHRGEAGGWTVEAPVAALEGLKVGQVDQVGSIVVWDDSERIFDGLVTAPDGVQRSLSNAGEVVSWSGKHSAVLLEYRRMWADPTTSPPWARARYVGKGQASTVVANAITLQAGIGALPERQIVGLQVQDTSAGTSGTWSAESTETLADFVSRVCVQADLSCVPAVNRDGVAFRIGARRDLSSTVVLAADSDLSSWTRKRVPATATHIIGFRDSGSVVTRTSGVAGAERIETVVDVPGEPDELVPAVDAELVAGASQWYVGAVLSPIGAARLRYMRDYRVGDFVGVMIGGDRFPLPVSSVVLRWSSDESSVTPVLGDASRDSLHRLFRFRRDFELLLRRRAI